MNPFSKWALGFLASFGLSSRVSLRVTLLRAFLFVGLLPALLLAALTFEWARSAIKEDTARNLDAQAAVLAADIDKTLFERLQNSATWSQLEVMQDLKVGDVDKRLSSFLSRLQSGYGGVYRELYAMDRSGRIVSSSNPQRIGAQAASAEVWQRVQLAGTELAVLAPALTRNGPVLEIRANIRSQFGDGTLGTLAIDYDWSRIQSLLARNAADGRVLLLLDASGRVLASSAAVPTQLLAGWPDAGYANVVRDGAPLIDGSVMAGSARMHLVENGPLLHMLIVQPLAIALAPAHRLAWISALILAGLVLLTVLVAGRVASRIARPVQALTGLTRAYGQQGVLLPPPAEASQGALELTELTENFVSMMRAIDQSQRQLVRASKLAVVGEMSAVIAHEVRTPLGILRSSAQILQREPLSPEGRELMGFIESETERLNRLVSTMLDSARPRAPRRAAADVHEIIRHSIALLGGQAEKRHISVATQFADDVDAVITCDAEQLTQLLLNLILNALQILHDGGRVLILTQADAAHFIIDIADDGPGIPEAERSRVFEAFFFRREGGVGLGLAIVQQIVAAHGGEIEALASEMGGALFRVRLPRSGKQAGEEMQ